MNIAILNSPLSPTFRSISPLSTRYNAPNTRVKKRGSNQGLLSVTRPKP